MTVQRHRHTWLTWDWEKISYNDIKDKPSSLEFNAKRDTLLITTSHSWDTFVNCWFEPKMIEIYAIPSWWWYVAWSRWTGTAFWNNWCIHKDETDGKMKNVSSYVYNIYDNPNWSQWYIRNTTSTWFNLYTNKNDIEVDIHYVAYW